MEQTNTDSSSFFYLSAETRWFMPGDVPPAFQRWFDRSSLKQDYEPRIDTYLVYPNAASAGVKFRENRFEIKSLVRPLGELDVGDRFRGEAAIWEKWSVAGPFVSMFFNEAGDDRSRWTEVTKTRTIRKYATDGPEVREVDTAGGCGKHDDGCYVELTQLEVLNKKYWTLGFESFAGTRELSDNLFRTIDFFSRTLNNPLTFPAGRSFAYTEFLTDLLG